MGRSRQGRPITGKIKISPFLWVAHDPKSQRTFVDINMYFIQGRFKGVIYEATWHMGEIWATWKVAVLEQAGTHWGWPQEGLAVPGSGLVGYRRKGMHARRSHTSISHVQPCSRAHYNMITPLRGFWYQIWTRLHFSCHLGYHWCGRGDSSWTHWTADC